jgi:hypothetical protein
MTGSGEDGRHTKRPYGDGAAGGAFSITFVTGLEPS